MKRRATHRSKSTKKLVAVKDTEGRFDDVQAYEKEHRKDLKKKRTSLQKKKDDPNSKYWKTKADSLFSKLIRARDEKCICCGRVDLLQCAHIQARENRDVRFHPMNAITLCPSCHKFSRKMSIHKNPATFFAWLKANHPEYWDNIGKLPLHPTAKASYREAYHYMEGGGLNDRRIGSNIVFAGEDHLN